MTRLLFVVLIASLIAGAQQRSGRSSRSRAQRTPVVVELFTSEGCSSCPALGEHVDYWDNLGWKDRFSSPLFSTRQQDYGVAFHSSNVYTPQAVVNGQKEVLGSDMRALLRAVGEVSPLSGTELELRISALDTLHLRVGKLPAGSHKADVLLAIAENNIETDVRAGENNGRRLRHIAVVRTMSKLAELDPAKPGEYTAEARLNLRPEWKRANVKVVLLVQDRETRKILAAGSVKL